jgi:hypothetical protein
VFAGKDSMCGRGLSLAETEDVCGRRNVFWGRIRCMTIECKFSNNEKMQKRRPMSRRCKLRENVGRMLRVFMSRMCELRENVGSIRSNLMSIRVKNV